MNCLLCCILYQTCLLGVDRQSVAGTFRPPWSFSIPRPGSISLSWDIASLDNSMTRSSNGRSNGHYQFWWMVEASKAAAKELNSEFY